ncbi:MAG: LysR family transcriptional regulator [Clostridiales bacterium]
MKLQQLRYFQAACRYGSTLHAAEALHISQPTVSMAIKELEQEFGLTLITRQYKGFSLTHEGKTFLELTERLLDYADNVVQIMRDLGQKRNLIRLGMPPMIGSILFPMIYVDFGRKHPEVNFTTAESGSRMLLQQLNDNLLDMVFVPHTGPLPAEYGAIPVMCMETVCCVSKEHRLAKNQSITVEDLRNEPLVMFRNSFFQNELISQMFERRSIEPKVLHYSEQLSTIQKLVESNTAVGFIFRNISEQITNIVNLSFEPKVTLQVSLAWRNSSYMYSDMLKFIQYFKSLKLDKADA